MIFQENIAVKHHSDSHSADSEMIRVMNKHIDIKVLMAHFI